MFSRLTGRKTQDNAPASPATQPSTVKSGQHQPGIPLELVRYDTETGKFHAGEDALKVLRSTSQPVGVVAVCGRARQGKSFILNQLLGQSTGFQVAPTVRPCTKGLWMWSAPIKRKAADGSQHQLVLIIYVEPTWCHTYFVSHVLTQVLHVCSGVVGLRGH